MEEPLTVRIRRAVCAWLENVTETPVPLSRVKAADAYPLATSAFVKTRSAQALLPRLTETLPACTAEGVLLLSAVTERNGWLLFSFSDACWNMLVARAAALKNDGDGSYLSNRMRILMRHGSCPCPDDERVRRALWLCLLAHDGRGFTQETERAVLTMTHHLTGMPRVALEHSCGGVAAAILHLKGDSPCT